MSQKKRPVFERSVGPDFSIFDLDIAFLYGLYVEKSEYKRKLAESENYGNTDPLVLCEKNGLFIWIFLGNSRKEDKIYCITSCKYESEATTVTNYIYTIYIKYF